MNEFSPLALLIAIERGVMVFFLPLILVILGGTLCHGRYCPAKTKG